MTAAIDKAPFALANLIAVAYVWGARQTDLRLLKWKQVPAADSKDAYVHVDESKTRKERDHEITPTVRFFLERAVQHRESVVVRYEEAAAKLEANSQYRRAAARRARAAAVRAQPYVFLTTRGLPWGKWALQSAMRRLEVDFNFRSLRPKAETDRPGTRPYWADAACLYAPAEAEGGEMTIEEAQRIREANEELYWLIEGGVAKLDGRFTVRELEAVITLMPMTATEVLRGTPEKPPKITARGLRDSTVTTIASR